jgi:hypothetical protein
MANVGAVLKNAQRVWLRLRDALDQKQKEKKGALHPYYICFGRYFLLRIGARDSHTFSGNESSISAWQ